MTTPAHFTSNNPPPALLVKKFIEVRDGKNKSHVFVEGRRLIEDLLNSTAVPTDVICTAEQKDFIENLFLHSAHPSCRRYVANTPTMKRVSALDTPPGIICLARRPQYDEHIDLGTSQPSLILFLDQIQNPQNVGALIRTAEASGVTEVWTSPQTCDPFSPKALRGSSGSVFRMPIKTHRELSSSLNFFKEKGILVYAAMKNSTTELHEIDWKKPSVIIMGNEGAGLDEKGILGQAIPVKIPMAGKVESLNVGVAGALFLYEAFRQRGGFRGPQ